MEKKRGELLKALYDLRTKLKETFNIPIDLTQAIDDIREFIVSSELKKK